MGHGCQGYNILAIAFLNRGNTPIALDYYLTGLGYCKKYKLANEENVINLNLGTLYLGNEQWNEAQRYFEKVSSDIKAYPKTPNYYGLMSCVAVCLGGALCSGNRMSACRHSWIIWIRSAGSTCRRSSASPR